MAAIEVRRLVSDDAEDYRAIRLAALRGDPDAFGSVYAVEAERPLAEFAQRIDDCVVLGAYAGGRIVGVVGFKQETGPKDSHKGFVFGLYVHPDWRRHGVGMKLMKALIASAKGGVEQLTLAVVQDNSHATALYRTLGFEIYGVEPRALKTADGYSDEALMVLFLQGS